MMQVQSQVVMNQLCIGFVITNHPQIPKQFVPCIHSTPLNNVATIQSANRAAFTVSYATTKHNMNLLKKWFPELKCQPVVKVVDRVANAIVGVILENQMYVPVIQEPVANVVDRLQTVYNMDYLEADSKIFTNRVDEKRIQSRVNQLEDNFYRIFQYEVRVHINQEHNMHKRNKILRIIQSANDTKTFRNASITMHERRDKIEAILRDEVMKGVAVFQEMNATLYERMEKVRSCADSADPATSMYCLTAANGTRRVFFPKKNLVNPNKDNEVTYYLRMADELLRNARVRNTVLQPTFLFVKDVTIETEKRENEMVVLERDLETYLQRVHSMTDVKTTHRDFFPHNDFSMANKQRK
jgi:hypothetical protein